MGEMGRVRENKNLEGNSLLIQLRQLSIPAGGVGLHAATAALTAALAAALAAALTAALAAAALAAALAAAAKVYYYRAAAVRCGVSSSRVEMKNLMT